MQLDIIIYTNKIKVLGQFPGISLVVSTILYYNMYILFSDFDVFCSIQKVNMITRILIE